MFSDISNDYSKCRGFLGLGENERNVFNKELNSYLNEKYQKSSIYNAANWNIQKT